MLNKNIIVISVLLKLGKEMRGSPPACAFGGFEIGGSYTFNTIESLRISKLSMVADIITLPYPTLQGL